MIHEDLTYDKESRLGGGRSSSVCKGTLDGGIVAVKILSEEVPPDVRPSSRLIGSNSLSVHL